MKRILLLGFFLSTSLSAHEGHEHETAPQVPPVVVTQPQQAAPFSEMASHLSFKTAHVHVFWSQTPKVGSAPTVRLELRDFDTHELLNENAELFFGYRLEGAKDFTLSEVAPARAEDGSIILGNFDASPLALSKAGNWEFFAILKRSGESAGIKSFKWTLASEPTAK